jgi:hypothetical protein
MVMTMVVSSVTASARHCAHRSGGEDQPAQGFLPVLVRRLSPPVCVGDGVGEGGRKGGSGREGGREGGAGKKGMRDGE